MNKNFDCALCGESLVFGEGRVKYCLPYWEIQVFNEKKGICKHCFSRLKMVDEGL